MIEKDRTYQVLAMLGTLPFIASAVMAVTGFTLGERITGNLVVSSYGLAILCFLCGAHWATYIYNKQQTPFNLFVISNVVVVAIWMAYVFVGQSPYSLFTQMLAFAFLLDIDRRLLRIGLIAPDYFRVRLLATTIAEVCLFIVVLADVA